MTLTDRINSLINAESLLKPGSRVVVGLSGGADSVALLSVLTELGYECHAVHCHFGLRGDEADRDANFSRKIATKLNAAFSVVRFETAQYAKENGVSLEMACRDLRYAEFERLRSEIGADAIAVGHHREDNVETLLLNLLRGTGIHGIRGMLPRRGNIVRPLLETSKAELLEYLQERGLTYIVDSSNLSNDFKRNKIRNIVLPALTEAFPDAVDSIARSLANLRGCEALYNQLLPERSDSLDGVSSTLLHEWLEPYGFNSAQCRDMLAATVGAQFRSDSHIVTICSGNRYELTAANLEPVKPTLRAETFPAGPTFNPENGNLYLDAVALEGNPQWELRLCRPGDRFKPFGMRHGSKPVADVLNECGVSASARKNSWVLCRNGQILWIVGHRASALFPVTKKTEKIIKISIS